MLSNLCSQIQLDKTKPAASLSLCLPLVCLYLLQNLQALWRQHILSFSFSESLLMWKIIISSGCMCNIFIYLFIFACMQSLSSPLYSEIAFILYVHWQQGSKNHQQLWVVYNRAMFFPFSSPSEEDILELQ